MVLLEGQETTRGVDSADLSSVSGTAPAERRVVETISSQLVSKLLHTPTVEPTRMTSGRETWTSGELELVAAADELQLASARRDGTLRKPVTIWVVRDGDNLYVRSVYGRGSSWFRGVLDRHEGHVSAGGVDRDVTFVEVADADHALDAAYRGKYHRYEARLVEPMASPEARAATIKLVPRSAPG